MKKFIIILFFGVFLIEGHAQSYWNLNGNNGTTSSNFVGTTDFKPLIFKTNNLERMRLLEDKAFLGIGISTPLATLHLHCHNEQTMVELLKDLDLSRAPEYKLLQLTTARTGISEASGFVVSCVNSDIYFKYYEPGNFSLLGYDGGLTIAPDGNVGIGNTNPQARLDVDGSLKATSATINDLLSAQSANVSKAMLFDAGANYYPEGRWGIELNATDYGLDFWKYNPLTKPHFHSVLLLSNNGNVGISNTNPQARLDVNGSLKATSATITNSLTANALNAQSATITNSLTANTLNAQSATITNSLTANALNISGAIAAQSANINGKIKAKEVEVTLVGWPDFVFDNNYNLLSLSEVEQYIKQNNRLPNIPSAKEVTENGIELGEMQSKLLQKIEEMTLYIIDLKKQMDELKQMKGVQK